MAKQTVRVHIPRNTDQLLDLGLKIYTKFEADGDKSPLRTLQDHNWTDIGPNLQRAKQKHDEAEKLQGLMEQAYKERDNYLGDISAVIRASKNLLLPVYAKNPKKLTDYGFDVSDTPKAKPDSEKKS